MRRFNWGRRLSVLPIWLFLTGLGVLLTACAAVKVQPAGPPPLPQHWQQASGERDVFPAADLRSWWTAFRDPGLNQMVRRALTSNLDLEAAKARVRAAASWLGYRRQQFKPTLDFRTHNAQPADTQDSYFQFGLDASWELGLFGRTHAVREAAQGEMDEVRARAAGVRVALVSQVAADYLRLKAGLKRCDFYTTIARLDRQRLLLLQRQVHLGLASPAAVAHLQADVAENQALLPACKLEVRQSAQDLALLMGQSEPDPDWWQSSPFPVVSSPQFALPPAALLRTRPDVRQAEARVLQAAGALGVAHANRYPSITLVAGLMWSTNVSRQHHVDRDFQAAPGLGPEIDIPLFDWGRRRAAEDARGAELRAASLAYRQTVLKAVAEVEDAFAGLQAATQTLLQRQHLLTAQQHLVAVQQQLAALGLASPQDVLQVRGLRLQAQAQLNLAQLQQDLAFVTLYQAYGGPPFEPGDQG